MRKGFLIALSLLFIATTAMARSPLTEDFMEGAMPIKSLGSLTFGPEGILFVGDYQSATVFAVDLSDAPNTDKNQMAVDNIDEKVAAMLGTTAKDIRIHDLAVNPISQNAYMSVSRGAEGMHILLRITPAGQIEEVSLQNVRYSKKAISNAISKDAKSRRGQSLRVSAITDLVYSDGKLYVAGLSNEEFSSTLRTVSFPFNSDESASSLEIYHAAHQRYETNSPIRTLMAYKLEQKPHLLAAYTCTPLVTFPVSKLNNGDHVKGKTVAELGSGNRPLDLLVYQNKGKDYILLANSNRALIKIDPRHIEMQKVGLTEPVAEPFATAGVKHIVTNQVGVQQIDNLNGDYILALQRMSNGALNLRSISKSRL